MFPRIKVVESELEKLRQLVEQTERGPTGHLAARLEQELDRAEVCREAPPGQVVRHKVGQGSMFWFELRHAGTRPAAHALEQQPAVESPTLH